ncbi:hypothetical protein J2X97_003794, partial [Epilithonimonas hungarica]|uniref:hypothetical protein n=1 Tax=Epilithonimonas hungarica TaxID=454006 RepID=UPI002789D472
MRKKITTGLLLLMQFVFGQQDPSSQNANGVSNTASPNVAGFMRFQESPVNYYNGRGNFSIPIYEINVGGIKYPISLNYSHGGIQINSMASDVGLGWSLTSTFVNRTVVGDADLETVHNKYGYFDFKENNYYPNVYGEYLNVDFYPDIFKFVSPNNRSNFYFVSRNQPIELDQKRISINWTIENKSNLQYIKNNTHSWINNSLTISDYKDFNLITKDGISYSFNDKDVTHSFVKSNENEYSSFGNIAGTYPRVSSWNVSKIKNMNNQEEINFIYENYSSKGVTDNMDDIINTYPYYNYEAKYPESIIPENPYIQFRVDQSSMESDRGRYYNRLLEVQRLKKIIFRGGSVEFDYGENRLDLTNGKALTRIFVKDEHDNIIKEFELKYDYFNSTLVKNEFSKRLKLLSVQEKGQNKYEFQYYEDNKLPNIGSPLQDFFGYNNAIETATETPDHYNSKYYYYPNKYEYSILPYDIISDNNHYLLEGQIDKEPNDLSKVWSLKSVKLPTGGTKTFVLESNTFNLWGNNLKGGGTRLQKQIIKESAVSSERTIDYIYKKDTNMTSGYLFNVPNAGYPASMLFPKSDNNPDLSSFGNALKKYFFLFGNAKFNYDLINNFFIGYSKVEENEDGVKTIYEFTNEEKPNILARSYSQDSNVTYFPLHPIGEFLISNSAYGNNFYVDNSYRRGKLKKVSYYEKNKPSPIMIKENLYQGYVEQSGEDIDFGHYLPGPAIYSNPLGIGEFWELMQFQKSYFTTNYNLTHTKTTQYMPSGNIADETYMFYNVQDQNLEGTAHKIADASINANFEVKKYFYPEHFPHDELMRDLSNINKINTPILVQSFSQEFNPSEFWTFNFSHMTSQSKAVFSKDAATSNMIMPVQAMTAIGQGS